METFWSVLGWSMVAASGVAYLWVAYRVVLFPKPSSNKPHKPESRLAA